MDRLTIVDPRDFGTVSDAEVIPGRVLKPLQVAVIGCGVIGGRRAAQVVADGEARLGWVADTNIQQRMLFAERYACQAVEEWRDILEMDEVDAVIVSTPNHLLAEIAVAALQRGKHVLVEKPLGKNRREAEQIVAYQGALVVKTGFNHRFHPAIATAKQWVDEGKIGDLLTIRAHYGHGGRPGMEKEWRSSKELCGGGELLDQGVHLIDLIQWFGGDILQVFGCVETKFWNIEVEDNAFVIAHTNQNVSASFHVSWTQWKNQFSFEIFGNRGSLAIRGLGGSYGTETLEWVTRKPEGGVPEISCIEFPGGDQSWHHEWLEFKYAIQEKRHPLGNGWDGLKANLVIDAIYQSHVLKQMVDVAQPSC